MFRNVSPGIPSALTCPVLPVSKLTAWQYLKAGPKLTGAKIQLTEIYAKAHTSLIEYANGKIRWERQKFETSSCNGPSTGCCTDAASHVCHRKGQSMLLTPGSCVDNMGITTGSADTEPPHAGLGAWVWPPSPLTSTSPSFTVSLPKIRHLLCISDSLASNSQPTALTRARGMLTWRRCFPVWPATAFAPSHADRTRLGPFWAVKSSANVQEEQHERDRGQETRVQCEG